VLQILALRLEFFQKKFLKNIQGLAQGNKK